MTARRERWLAFIEEAIGFLALVGVAVGRSGNPDRWSTFALLVGAYVAGMLGACAVLERRLPFTRTARRMRAATSDGPGPSAGLEVLGAVVAFVVLTVAFDRGRLPSSVQWLGLAVVATAAWTMGHGLAGAVRLVPFAGRLHLPGRLRHAPHVGWPTKGP